MVGVSVGSGKKVIPSDRFVSLPGLLGPGRWTSDVVPVKISSLRILRVVTGSGTRVVGTNPSPRSPMESPVTVIAETSRGKTLVLRVTFPGLVSPTPRRKRRTGVP